MSKCSRRSLLGLAAVALPALSLPGAVQAQSIRRPTVVNGRRYLHYDVFTDVPLAGNQLAVFTDTAGLTAAQMQAMTRETKFSECTFVQPSELAVIRVALLAVMLICLFRPLLVVKAAVAQSRLV